MKIDADLKEKIEKNALSVATVAGIKPHCIAVGYAKVVNSKIIITNNYMNKTPENIKGNRNIAITLYSPDWEKNCWGFELTGTAEYLTSGKWSDFVKNMPENKGYPAKGAIVVTVDKIKKLA